MNNEEKMIITNSFGTVTNKRVQFTTKEYENELPIKNIYSITFPRKHNIIPATIYFILSISLLVSVFVIESTPELFEKIHLWIIILCIIGTGVLFILSMVQYLGHHIIRINDMGEDRILIKVKLSQTKEGRDFMQAIEEHIVGEQ